MGNRWRTVPAVKLFFIGDIVGKPGRRAVRYFLPGADSNGIAANEAAVAAAEVFKKLRREGLMGVG